MPTLIGHALATDGLAVVRGLIPRAVAMRIDERIRANLARCEPTFPNYQQDANYSVMPISMAMADEADATLPRRVADARASGSVLAPSFVTAGEVDRLKSELAPLLELLGDTVTMAGVDNCYARYESARPNSAYGSYYIHQDSVFELHGLTAWIALCRCGVDAPALQFIRGRRSKLLPTATREAKHIDPKRFRESQWERPIYEPGDVVIFDSYTVHGTYVDRSMKASRTSMDVRFHITKP